MNDHTDSIPLNLAILLLFMPELSPLSTKVFPRICWTTTKSTSVLEQARVVVHLPKGNMEASQKGIENIQAI